MAAVKAPGNGDALISPTLTLDLLSRCSQDSRTGEDRVAGLRERENDVARLVAQGRTNQGICGELYISLGTVKSHLSDIQTRLEARIATLDVLRGLALCGIMIVNLPPLSGLGVLTENGSVESFYAFEQDFVQNRFFPIFSILFGVGFGLRWNSARARSPRPRLALLRRFLLLGLLGAGHLLLQPGEALLPYAIAAIIILLPRRGFPPGLWPRPPRSPEPCSWLRACTPVAVR